MATFTRDVSLLSKFDKHSAPEQVIYIPGTINSNTVTPGVDYSGLVKNLVLIAELDYYQTIQFWIDDVDGNRYLLDNEIKLRTTTKPINLLEDVFSSNEINIAPGNKLGMTVLYPNNFIKGTNDFVTIFGFVSEKAEQDDNEANQTALALIGVELGIAPLDADARVPIINLPGWQELPGLETSLNTKQPLGDYALNTHEHIIANVSGLQDALDEKQAVGDYTTKLIGEPIWLPYSVSGQPYTDSSGWLWYQPDGTPISVQTHIKLHKLFLALWNDYPISEGKGLTAQDDWDANKSLVFPDLRGRMMLASGEGNLLTNRSIGETGGKETHTQLVSEMPSHAHNETMWSRPDGSTKYRVNSSNYYIAESSGTVGLGGNLHETPYAGMYTGGGSPMPIMPPWFAFSLLLWMGEKA